MIEARWEVVPRGGFAPGRHKAVKVTITMEDHPPVQFKIRLTTTKDDLVANTDVIADPPVADIGSVNAGNLISTSVHLVNIGKVARQVTTTRAACKCTTFPDFTPFELAADAESDVHVEVDVPDDTAGEIYKDITVFVAGQKPVKVPLRMTITHPLVDELERRLAKQYPGAYSYDEFRIADNVVTAVAWETDRSRPVARITCRFDDTGRIEDLAFDSITTHRVAKDPAA